MSASDRIPHEIEQALRLHRRDFLRSAGLLAVSLAAHGGAWGTEADAQGSAALQGAGLYPNPDFHQLDSWIVIHENNTATFYVGKTDPGQGTGTGFRQLMSDELDIAFEKTTCIMGRTDLTVDQVGSGGSTAMERDSWPMRRVAAEARRVLLDMGSTRLGVPVDQLAVRDAVIAAKADPSKRITYGELIGGEEFNVTLTGANVNAVTGQAKTKTVPELEYTGQPLQRDDIPAKVDGSLKWAVDVKLPGMVHARNVKPPYACATLTGIDESSVKSLPGFIKVLSKGNYVAVVCEREEQAIRAARQLKTTWEKPKTAPFPSSDNLFDYMRTAPPASASGSGDAETRNPAAAPAMVGNVDAAFATAAKTLEAEYEIPFQGHTALAGAHATADPSDGQMTVYSNDMKSYGMRRGVATFLGMPQDRVRVIWMQGPQGFGRTAAEDAACEAAWIARELGRPVRVQWMRDEETAWDTKSPAFLVKMRGALDAEGRLDWLRLQGALLRLQPRRLQRAGYGPDRATHGVAAATTGCRQRIAAVGHVRHSESPNGGRGRRAAAHLGNAASHRQSARSEWTASDIRRRVVHRRSGGGGEGRSARFPREADQRRDERRRRIPTGSIARGAQGRRRRLWLGSRGLRRNRSAAATS